LSSGLHDIVTRKPHDGRLNLCEASCGRSIIKVDFAT
jgi:hypothetical protein